MQVGSSKLLEAKRPLLKKLLQELLNSYPYASVLAADAKGKIYSISKQGTNIAEDDIYTERGYVIKVYDGESYGEYAFNRLEEDDIGEILDKVKEHLMPWKESLGSGLSVKRYPCIPEEEISFEKSTEYQVHPDELGDEAIIEKLTALRETALARGDSLLDCRTACLYQVYHKLFLSPKKELTQNVMWTTGMMSAMAARGEEIKDSFVSSGGLGGAEALEELEGKIPELLENIELLLKSEPMMPGEYDCICTPEVTGMIVHEAFGH